MNVSNALKALEQEYYEGDLTQKGYMKKRAVLLEPFKNLIAVNGTISFGVKEVKDDQEEGRVPVDGAKVEENPPDGGHVPVDKADAAQNPEEGRGPVGGARKLLSFMDAEGAGDDEERESRRLAKVVAIAKMKEMNRERDLRKAVEEWEKKYGQWVSESSA